MLFFGCRSYGATFPNSCGYCQGQPTGDCMVNTNSSKEKLEQREQQNIQSTSGKAVFINVFSVMSNSNSVSFLRRDPTPGENIQSPIIVKWKRWRFEIFKYNLVPGTDYCELRIMMLVLAEPIKPLATAPPRLTGRKSSRASMPRGPCSPGLHMWKAMATNPTVVGRWYTSSGSWRLPTALTREWEHSDNLIREKKNLENTMYLQKRHRAREYHSGWCQWGCQGRYRGRSVQCTCNIAERLRVWSSDLLGFHDFL